jgi:signal transduction histidine kinase
MSRRILLAIVGVTAVAVVGFGIPLGITVAHLYRDEAVSALERDANKAIAEIPVPFSAVDTPELPTPDGGTQLAVYDGNGNRIAGSGPARADQPVLQSLAIAGPVTADSAGDSLVVVIPLSRDEQVLAIVRAAVPQHLVTDRVHRAWLAMAGLALAVIGVAALVAVVQARRLSRPVKQLAAAADRLGQGDFAIRAGRAGIPEIDAAAAALDTTAERLGELLQRERAFSAHASHQLRTPLTGLRVQLEAATLNPEADPRAALAEALQSVDQLEQTIDDLLTLARDVGPRVGPLDLRSLFDEVNQRWHGPLADTGRPLRTVVQPDLPDATASPAALRQILDVLVGNAVEHGAGTVTVAARAAGGGIAIEVSDEGPGIASDAGDVFAPRTDPTTGRGIGLGLASSLAAAEGGRLLLGHHGPGPIFRILFAGDDGPREERSPNGK